MGRALSTFPRTTCALEAHVEAVRGAEVEELTSYTFVHKSTSRLVLRAVRESVRRMRRWQGMTNDQVGGQTRVAENRLSQALQVAHHAAEKRAARKH